MAGKYGLSRGPVKGKEAEWTGIDWQGHTVRSINDRPFYPRVQNISVLNPKKGHGEPSRIVIPNPDFRSGHTKDSDNWKPMSDAEFTQLLESKPETKHLATAMNRPQSKSTNVSSPLPVVNNAASKKEAKPTRLMIYAKAIHKIEYKYFTMERLVIEAKKKLKIGEGARILPMKVRESNFIIFKNNHFQKKPADDFELAELTALEQPFVSGTKSYDAMFLYAKTKYGSLMIERVIKDTKTPKLKIYTYDNGEAMANENYIRLPSEFPKITHYPIGGQKIHPLAVIHHEFEHTRYGTVKNKFGSMKDEVAAVTQHENPIRIIDGYEPRYTYYDSDTNTTAEVTTGTTKTGKFKADPSDPRILIL